MTETVEITTALPVARESAWDVFSRIAEALSVTLGVPVGTESSWIGAPEIEVRRTVAGMSATLTVKLDSPLTPSARSVVVLVNVSGGIHGAAAAIAHASLYREIAEAACLAEAIADGKAYRLTAEEGA